MQSIAVQDYPKELVEVIVAYGGSTDGTLEIAQKYGVNILATFPVCTRISMYP